jgi:hypothetical protein
MQLIALGYRYLSPTRSMLCKACELLLMLLMPSWS